MLIGRGGFTLNQLQLQSGASLWMGQSTSTEGFSTLIIKGSDWAVETARRLVQRKLAYVEAGHGRPPSSSWGQPPGHSAWGAAPGDYRGNARQHRRLPYDWLQHVDCHTETYQVPKLLLRTALQALLGVWFGKGADGSQRCYKVALGFDRHRPQLCCRSWIVDDDGKIAGGEASNRPVRYEGGDILLGGPAQQQRLFMDVVTDQHVVWANLESSAVRFTWSRECPFANFEGPESSSSEDEGEPWQWKGNAPGRGRPWEMDVKRKPVVEPKPTSFKLRLEEFPTLGLRKVTPDLEPGPPTPGLDCPEEAKDEMDLRKDAAPHLDSDVLPDSSR